LGEKKHTKMMWVDWEGSRWGYIKYTHIRENVCQDRIDWTERKIVLISSTLYSSSIPTVVRSPLWNSNWVIGAVWQCRLFFLETSTLISPFSHNNILPHSQPDIT
jgi:hypothetical protein